MTVVLPPMGKFQFNCAYTSKLNVGNAAYTFNPCGYTPSANEEIHPSLGVYVKYQMAIDIPKSILDDQGGYEPKPGDFFTGPDGNVYNVIKVQTFSLFFVRVVGLCPTLSYVLTDQADYMRVRLITDPNATDQYADKINDPQLVLAGVLCRIQPDYSVPQDILAKLGSNQRFFIWTLNTIDVLLGDLFIDRRPVTPIRYKVVSWSEKQDLQYLLQIVAERQP